MSRTRYLDYRVEDSTELLNNMLRGMLEAGVYLGYNVSQGGSGTWWLQFTHDTDPDNTGEVLGVIRMPDGVVIQEDANQDDVAYGAAPTADEIHWLVATYTYNKALPNNDVVYYVKTATAPSTPTLTDDEILIAEIDVPVGSTSYSDSGVYIKNVAKKRLYGISDYELFRAFIGILDPGIYDGMELTEGTTSLDVNLEAGTWVSQENAKIVESVQQADLFTITNPGSGYYSLSWVVGMHKNEDTDPAPSTDYLLVQGTAALVGTEASLPNNTTILAAAAAVNAKYDDASYINKLGYIRTENRSGTYIVNYYKGETVLQQETVIVYGAEASSLGRSGKYFGHQGLIDAIDDIYALTQDSTASLNLKTPYTILLDGKFKLADDPLRLPSHTKLLGYGAPAILESDFAGDVVRIQGLYLGYDYANDTVTQVVGPSSPPSGYVSRTFEIQSTYRTGDDLVERKFTYGDRIQLDSDNEGITWNGYYVQTITTSNNWTFEAFVETDYGSYNSTDLFVDIFKDNVHLKDITVREINSGAGKLTIDQIENCTFKGINATAVDALKIYYCRFDDFDVHGDMSFITVYNSHFGHIKSTGASTIDFKILARSHVEYFEYDDSAITLTLNFQADNSSVDCLRVTSDTGSTINLLGDRGYYGQISGGDPLVIQGWKNTISHYVGSELEFAAGSYDNIIVAGDFTTFTDTAADPRNRVLYSATLTMADEIAEIPHSDRNLMMVSLAVITWESDVLTWDAAIKFDNPWTTGYSEIAAGNSTLAADGDRLYVDIDRDATGTASVSTSVRAKASATTDKYARDRIFVALRDQGVIYLWDGTRIEEGQSVTIGSTPPPEGSVTYSKLADDALAFHNNFYRDYVSLDGDVDWPREVVVRNTDLRTMTYTVATGVIQYSGAIDLSGVNVGDMVLLVNNNDSGTNAWVREEIYAVDDSSNELTISPGLGSLVTGAATIWNGAVVRGDVIVDNYSLSTLSYDETNGRVAFVPGLDFSQHQVQPGYLFIDTNGKEYLIQDRDTSGNGDWVDIGIGKRDVGVATPTETWQGSIRVNNNPHKIKTADLKVSSGMEFIPIDWYGQRDEADGEDIEGFSASEDGRQKMFSEPRDPRIRVWIEAQARSSYNTAPGYNASVSPDKISLQPMDQSFVYVDVTALCTGVSLVIEHMGSITNAVGVYYDGELLNYNARFSGAQDCNNTYSPDRHFHANVVTQTFMNRVPLGVHNVRWTIPQNLSGGNVNTVFVRGIIIHTTPGSDDTKVVHSPGTLVKKGGIVEFTEPVIASLPSSTETWNKGGRVVRYVDSTDSYTWGSNWIRGFTDTGNTANGSGDITSVVSPEQWVVGDLMMLINGAARTLHAITAIVGTTITVTPSVGFTSPTHTLYYYGHVPYDSANDYYDRPNEEVAAQFMLSEFACGGPVNEHRGPAAYEVSSPRTNYIGVRLSDLMTLLESSTGWENTSADDNTDLYPMDWLKWPNLGKLRLRFLGTGLALTIRGTTNLGIRVDGMPSDAATLSSSATRKNDRTGGTYIVGELPYGYHTVEITDTTGSPDQIVQKVTIFKPRKPSIPSDSFELLDTNIKGATDNELGIDPIDGTGQMQLGNVNYDAGAITRLEITDSLSDAVGDYAGAIGCKDWRWSSGGAPSSATYSFLFTGKEFTLVWDGLSLGGANPIDILVKDCDGQFRAPSALTGFTVTGSDTIATIASTSTRDRWIFSVGGTHVIRISPGNVGDNVNMNSIEVSPMLHNYRTKKPVGYEHYMPFQHCGLDVRNMSPIPAHLLPSPTFEHVQTRYDDSVVAMEEQTPFFFYSPGGLMEISVIGGVSHNQAVGTSWRVEIDGYRYVPFLFSAFQDSAAATGSGIYFKNTMWLPTGWHWAIVRGTTVTSDDVAVVTWSARCVPNGPGNSLINRGVFSNVGLGGVKTERSY